MQGHGQPMGLQGKNLGEVEEVTELNSRDFYAQYVRLNKPVVVRGAIKDQPYFQKWKDDAYMVKHFGETQVVVEKAKIEDRAAEVGMADMSLTE